MPDRPFRRTAALGYGWFAYLFALATILYAIAFVGDIIVPKSIDSGATVWFGDPLLQDAVFLGLFGVQHSLMARPWFKRAWTNVVPQPIERSTYVVFASAALVLVMVGWRPLPGLVWHVSGVSTAVVWAVYACGWMLVIASVNVIDKEEFMGLRQVSAYFQGRTSTPIEFQTPSLYQVVRHPMMLGFLIAFWVTPTMTASHLVFATGMSVYVLLGLRLEERDLVAAFGERYRRYQATVPMVVPRPWRVGFELARTEALVDVDNEGVDQDAG